MDQASVDRVLSGAAELRVDLTRAQASDLLKHLTLVLEQNRLQNLTSIVDWDSAIRLHVLDSVAAARFVSPTHARIADIGSGAGYPGIPIAIVLGRPVDLVEPTRKKADFLSAVVRELGGLCGTEAIPLRAEILALERARRYEAVLARGVSSLPSLVELAAPLLDEGGVFLALKGVPAAEERQSGRIAAEMLGMAETGWHEYRLPIGGERRTVAEYTKCGEPSRALPRRVGVAQKRPLA